MIISVQNIIFKMFALINSQYLVTKYVLNKMPSFKKPQHYPPLKITLNAMKYDT